MKVIYKIILIHILFVATSCVGDLDFDQVEDFEFEPTVTASLFNFDIAIDDFIEEEIPFDVTTTRTVTDETDLPPEFQSSLVQEDLDKIALEFEINNTFTAEFTITINFVDDANTVLYTVPTIVMSANQETTETLEIVILENPAILNATKISATIVFDGTLISGESPTLEFKSAGTFYFSIS